MWHWLNNGFVGTICVVLAAIVCTFQFPFVMRAGIADFISLPARESMWALRRTDQAPTLAVWQELAQDLEAAARFAPEAPQWREDLGYLYAVRGYRTQELPTMANAQFDHSIAYLRQAIERRPMASASWGMLALVSHYRGVSDEEIEHLFDVAMAYGRYDPATQMLLLGLGVRRWERLPSRQQAQLKESIRFAKGPLKTELTRIAHEYDQGRLESVLNGR